MITASDSNCGNSQVPSTHSHPPESHSLQEITCLSQAGPFLLVGTEGIVEVVVADRHIGYHVVQHLYVPHALTLHSRGGFLAVGTKDKRGKGSVVVYDVYAVGVQEVRGVKGDSRDDERWVLHYSKPSFLTISENAWISILLRSFGCFNVIKLTET